MKKKTSMHAMQPHLIGSWNPGGELGAFGNKRRLLSTWWHLPTDHHMLLL